MEKRGRKGKKKRWKEGYFSSSFSFFVWVGENEEKKKKEETGEKENVIFSFEGIFLKGIIL